MAIESADYGAGEKGMELQIRGCVSQFSFERGREYESPQAGILGGGTQLGNNRCQ